MSIKDDIKTSFQQGTLLTKLIYINLGVFLVVCLTQVFMTLFGHYSNWVSYLQLPSDLDGLLHRPWTIITYMFLHEGITHLIFNVLSLYWLGQLFLMFFSQKDLVGVYILGGLVGGAVYILAFNIFPLFDGVYGVLEGASASIMAIVLAPAVYSPGFRVRLFLVGNVKIEWIAAVYVLLSILGIASSNAGGELSHLGGALAGVLFAVFYKKGQNIVSWTEKPISWIINLFRRKPKMDVSYGAEEARNETDQQYNERKKRESDNIDRILEKIKKGGYESLTDDERKQLFK